MATMPTGHVLKLDDRTYFGIDMPVPREDMPRASLSYLPFKVYWEVYTDRGKKIGHGYRKHFQDAQQAIRRCAKRWHGRYKAGICCDCCNRGGEYNGYNSGPLLFECPNHCSCHD